MKYTQKQIDETLEQHKPRSPVVGKDPDMRYAEICSSIGESNNIKSAMLDGGVVFYTYDQIQIGCQRHFISEWMKFDDNRIFEIGGTAFLNWWRKWKPVIQQIIEMSPAEPTKSESDNV